MEHFENIRDVEWVNKKKTKIKFTFDMKGTGNTYHFVADPDDCTDHGREVFHRAKNGEYGPVKEKMSDRALKTEELKTSWRKQRNDRLADSDWTQLPDVPLSDDQKRAWKEYRQQLREMTKRADFPHAATFPPVPGESS